MFCEYGVVTKISHIGINPSDLPAKNTCKPVEKNAKCNDHLNTDFINTVKKEVTDLKPSEYSYTFTNSINNANSIWSNKETIDEVCTKQGAFIYI